jgi:hypothetical protein
MRLEDIPLIRQQFQALRGTDVTSMMLERNNMIKYFGRPIRADPLEVLDWIEHFLKEKL